METVTDAIKVVLVIKLYFPYRGPYTPRESAFLLQESQKQGEQPYLNILVIHTNWSENDSNVKSQSQRSALFTVEQVSIL